MCVTSPQIGRAVWWWKRGVGTHYRRSQRTMATASLNVVLFFSWLGTTHGLLPGVCPTGRRRQHHQQQRPFSSRKVDLLTLPATSDSSSSSHSGGSSSDVKPKGFGSRASRRTKGMRVGGGCYLRASHALVFCGAVVCVELKHDLGLSL